MEATPRWSNEKLQISAALKKKAKNTLVKISKPNTNKLLHSTLSRKLHTGRKGDYTQSVTEEYYRSIQCFK